MLGPGAADPRRGPLRTQASLEGHLHGTGMLRSPADGQDTRTTSGAAATTLSGATSTMGGRIPVGGVKLPGMNEVQSGALQGGLAQNKMPAGLGQQDMHHLQQQQQQQANQAQMGQMKPQGMQDAAGNLVPGAGGPNAQGTSSVTPGMSTVTTSAHDPLAANKPFGAGAQQQGLMNSQMNTNMSNIVSTQPNSHISNAVSNQTNAQISSQSSLQNNMNAQGNLALDPALNAQQGAFLQNQMQNNQLQANNMFGNKNQGAQMQGSQMQGQMGMQMQGQFGAGNLPGTQMGNHIQPGGTLPNQHMSNQPNQMTDVGQMNQMNQMQNAMGAHDSKNISSLIHGPQMQTRQQQNPQQQQQQQPQQQQHSSTASSALSGLSSLFGLQKNRPGKPHALHPSLLPRLLCLQVSASCKYLVVKRHTQW